MYYQLYVHGLVGYLWVQESKFSVIKKLNYTCIYIHIYRCMDTYIFVYMCVHVQQITNYKVPLPLGNGVRKLGPTQGAALPSEDPPVRYSDVGALPSAVKGYALGADRLREQELVIFPQPLGREQLVTTNRGSGGEGEQDQRNEQK